MAATFLVSSLLALAYTTNASATRAAHSERTRRVTVALAEGRYRNKVFDNVSVTRGIDYRDTVDHDGKPVSLALDVYQPAHDQLRHRPAVVWMHSGGFMTGGKNEFADWATALAQRGFVSVSIDYRLRPTMLWDDMTARAQAARDAYDDASAAIEWVQAHAGELGVDPRLVFAGGYSAGGIMAFDLAYPAPGEVHVKLAGAVAIAGYAYGSPQAGDAPVLAFHGTDDPLVPYAYAQDSCAAAKDVGDECDLVTYRGESHDIGTKRRAELFDRTVVFLVGAINHAA